ncbi:MAG TPA: hypothetical protein VNX68_15695 [Nitrosopumilaceae archaeon]|nr:hypothetical protein [Nitrosopumilaceae archaeon]
MDIKIKIQTIEDSFDHKLKATWKQTQKFGEAFKREAHETQLASKILLHLIEGHPETPEQISFLKEQSIDFGKVLVIIGLQAVPFSSVAIIALEKIGQKHGFTLFPKAQVDPNVEESKSINK